MVDTSRQAPRCSAGTRGGARQCVRLPHVVLAALATLAGTAAVAADTLRFAIGDAQTLPLAEFDGLRPQRGILVDFAKALADATGTQLEFVVLPRKREEAFETSGSVDVVCFSSPQWRTHPENYVWTRPLLIVPDVVFAHASVPEPEALHAIPYGTNLSAVLGYVYPGLEARFLDGRLKREDTADVQKVLLKVSAARTPLGVTNTLTLAWYRRTTPNHHLAPWTLVVDRSEYACAVPHKGHIDADRIVKAAEHLRTSGAIDAMVARYTQETR